MKTKIFILGCVAVSLCLFGCKKDKDDDLIKTISITSSIPILDVDETFDVSATVTPDAATETVVWEVKSTGIVTVTPKDASGRTATVTGVTVGTTQIFARSASSKAVSQEVTVTVERPDDPDLAGNMVGTYCGAGDMFGGMLDEPISNVSLIFTKIGESKASVNMKLTVYNISGFDELVLNATFNVSEGSTAGTYDLDGTGSMEIWDPSWGANNEVIVDFEITGTFNNGPQKVITLHSIADPAGQGAGQEMELTATLGACTPVPIITIGTQPSNVNVMEGSITESLTIAASATLGATPAYQWYSNTTNSTDGATVIDGATSATFAIPSTLTEANGPDYFYFCVVSAEGATSKTSNVAKVTVTSEPDDYDYAADVEGVYYGSGTCSMGTVKDAVFTVVRKDNNTIGVNIEGEITGPLSAMSGIWNGDLTISSGYSLNGNLFMSLDLATTGSIDNQTITLNMTGTYSGMTVTFNLTGELGEPEPEPDYAAEVAGDYTGTGQLASPMEMPLSGIELSLEHIDNETVKMTSVIDAPLVGEITCVGELTVSSDLTLSGTVTAEDFTFTVTGEYDEVSQILTLSLTNSGTPAIAMTLTLDRVED